MRRPLTQRIAGAAISVGSLALLVRWSDVDRSRRLLIAVAAVVLVSLLWTIWRLPSTGVGVAEDAGASRAGARVAAGAATGLLGLCLALWPEDTPSVVYARADLLLSSEAFEAGWIDSDRLPAGVAGTGAAVLAVAGLILWRRAGRSGSSAEHPA